MIHPTTPTDTYNYAVFEPGPMIQLDCDEPTPGTDLADITLQRLDGTPVTLGDLGDGIVVVETGSTTCPLYRRNVAKMRDVAARHPEVAFVVLYTREAHPGERRGPHRDMADKRHAAATLPDAADEWRDVLVDDLDGTLHRVLQGAPDSATILTANATVLAFVHDADPLVVDTLLDQVALGHARPGAGSRFVSPTPRVALAALGTGGWQAVRDFLRALPSLAAWRLRGGANC